MLQPNEGNIGAILTLVSHTHTQQGFAANCELTCCTVLGLDTDSLCCLVNLIVRNCADSTTLERFVKLITPTLIMGMVDPQFKLEEALDQSGCEGTDFVTVAAMGD